MYSPAQLVMQPPNKLDGLCTNQKRIVSPCLVHDSVWHLGPRPGSRRMFHTMSGINPYKILETIWCQIRFQSGGEALIRLECQVGSKRRWMKQGQTGTDKATYKTTIWQLFVKWSNEGLAEINAQSSWLHVLNPSTLVDSSNLSSLRTGNFCVTRGNDNTEWALR